MKTGAGSGSGAGEDKASAGDNPHSDHDAAVEHIVDTILRGSASGAGAVSLVHVLIVLKIQQLK